MATHVVAQKIGLFIVDSAADAFGEEINRYAVRSFIRLLKSIGCTTLLLGHPSVDGLKSGRGYSGSTHWNNSVRSRLYFTRATTDEGDCPDPDLRVLELAKANRAQTGQRMHLRWTEHGFIPDGTTAKSLDALERQLKTEDIYLKLLKRFWTEGRPPSPSPASRTYAPNVPRRSDEDRPHERTLFSARRDLLQIGMGAAEPP